MKLRGNNSKTRQVLNKKEKNWLVVWNNIKIPESTCFQSNGFKLSCALL